MTREEIEKWFSNLYPSGVGTTLNRCNNCSKPFTQEFIALNDVSKYQRVCQLLKQGTVNYQPHYQKVPSYKHGMLEVDHILIGAELSIKDAFCSRECFIEYVYDHQTELIELITQ